MPTMNAQRVLLAGSEMQNVAFVAESAKGAAIAVFAFHCFCTLARTAVVDACVDVDRFIGI